MEIWHTRLFGEIWEIFDEEAAGEGEEAEGKRWRIKRLLLLSITVHVIF